MKKALKIIMVVIMILGIAFSISNFISIGQVAASADRGVWVDLGSGVKECAGDGDECDIMIIEPG